MLAVTVPLSTVCQSFIVPWNVLQMRTQASPTQLSARNCSLLSVRLELDLARSIPRRSCLTRWDFGHVELERTWVEDVW
jgi:hypothetical protein